MPDPYRQQRRQRAPRRRLAGILALGAVAWLAGATAVEAISFHIIYTDDQSEGFDDPVLGEARRRAFEFAVAQWQSRIIGAPGAVVEIEASFDSLGGTATSATIGQGGPTAYAAGFGGALQSDVFYAISVANYLADDNLNGSAADVNLRFNSDVDGSVLGGIDWYYGVDLAAETDIDFVTVAMHEIGHGLGILSTFTSNGSYGLGFPRRPSSYDIHLVNADGQRLIDIGGGQSKVTQPIFWAGPWGTAMYEAEFEPGQPPLYAPSTYRPGSSISHLDEATFVGPYELMTPFASGPVHDTDMIVRGILADVGWQIAWPGDADGDGEVTVLDIVTVGTSFGVDWLSDSYVPGADLDGDGIVDTIDIARTITSFGRTGLLREDGMGMSQLAGTAGASYAMGSSSALVYSVPEPTTLSLLALAGLAPWRRRLRPYQAV